MGVDAVQAVPHTPGHEDIGRLFGVLKRLLGLHKTTAGC